MHVLDKPGNECTTNAFEALRIAMDVLGGKIEPRNLLTILGLNCLNRRLAIGCHSINDLLEHRVNDGAEFGLDRGRRGQAHNLLLREVLAICASRLVRHKVVERCGRKKLHVGMRFQKRAELGRIEHVVVAPLGFDCNAELVCLSRNFARVDKPRELLQSQPAGAVQLEVSLSARDGDKQQATRVVVVLFITNQQVGWVQTHAAGAFVPSGVVGIEQVDAVELQALRAMGAGEANSSRRAEVDRCVDTHAKLLSGIEFVDNIGQAKRASHAARVAHFTLGKGE